MNWPRRAVQIALRPGRPDPNQLGSLVNPSGWEPVDAVKIVCPSCFHTFEIRRDSVEPRDK
jgi:hypothetical protein